MTFSVFVDQNKTGTVSVAGPSVTIDTSVGSMFLLRLMSDSTLMPPVRSTDGKTITIAITQDEVGGHLLDISTGPGGFEFRDDVPVQISNEPNTTDYLTAIFSALNNKWHVVRFVKGFK